MKEAIQKAIELAILGGYSNVEIDANPEKNIMWKIGMTDIPDVFLQPLFWQALGKSLGWGVVKNVTKKKCKECMGYGYTLGENGEEYDCYTCGNTGREVTEEIVPSPWKNNWKYFWHQFIDHLAEGKDPESFFESLLSNHKGK